MSQSISVVNHTWQADVEQLASHFGYPLKLLTLAQAVERVGSLTQSLEMSEFVYANNDDPALIKRLENSDWVISLGFKETMDENVVRSVKGAVYLASQEFSNLGLDERPKLLEELKHAFGFEMTFIDKAQVSLSESKWTHLYSEGFTWNKDQTKQIFLYGSLPDEERLLKVGPIDLFNARLAPTVGIMVTIFIAISLGLLLWVFPLLRDLKKLDHTAAEFGDGRLDRRVSVGNSSVVSRIGHSFNTMANRIERQINENRELTNAIAHDLRTPLSRLRFAFEMYDAGGVEREDKQRYKRSIESSIDCLDHQINQILALSRYSRAVDITYFSLCSVADVVAHEVDQHSQDDTVQTVDLFVDNNMRERELFVDKRALTRAIGNLLGNASRYAESKILVSLKQVEGQCLLCVEDDGPGIAKDLAEKVFEPFAQLDNEQRTSDHHGLGLAIVQQVMLWHKGTVSLDKSVLGGAKFELSWPLELKK